MEVTAAAIYLPVPYLWPRTARGRTRGCGWQSAGGCSLRAPLPVPEVQGRLEEDGDFLAARDTRHVSVICNKARRN